ncbi:hypothetical protein HanXRQr2_Chr14g0644891 [Helianthus annuus]|uniref:Uncharacterized protein n=1 Tax=Helianthus annuus TaxID=4232 RepID=A0A251UL59_HELAN|nr:hypothetical protein HanXRQr2_Chr14g0644891 [Helianthus annuus]
MVKKHNFSLYGKIKELLSTRTQLTTIFILSICNILVVPHSLVLYSAYNIFTVWLHFEAFTFSPPTKLYCLPLAVYNGRICSNLLPLHYLKELMYKDDHDTLRLTWGLSDLKSSKTSLIYVPFYV